MPSQKFASVTGAWEQEVQGHLMALTAEDQDLRILGGGASRQEHQPAGHPDHEQVDETDKHERQA